MTARHAGPIDAAVQRETRVFSLTSAQTRADGDKPRHFTGHASVFNRLSVELWGFYERVSPNAFDSAIAGEDDVRFLINHEPTLLLARTKSGTLELSKDDDGLLADADLPDTGPARDLAVQMDRGDMDQMSFGFRTIEDSWDEEDVETNDGETVKISVRTLEKVELFDVSAVTFPAYPDTDAELNSAAYRYLGLQPAWGSGVVPMQLAAQEFTPAHAAQMRAAVGDQFAELHSALEELRVGKVLSKKNKTLVQGAVDALQELIAAAGDDDEEDEEQNAAPLSDVAIRRRRLRLLDRQLA
jgi:HK97 family phage prohead protease